MGIVVGGLLVLIGVVAAVLILNLASESTPPSRDPSPPVSGSASPGPSASVPPPSDPTFSFVALGDFGSRDASEDAVARRIRLLSREVEVDALVTTGDNVYPEGSPAYIVQAWDEPYGWLERTEIDVYASLGNHDVGYEGGQAVIESLDMPSRWYTRRVGDVQLFVLDSNAVADLRQTRWLEEALARSRAPWEMVAFHHAPYSCSKHGNYAPVIDEWVDLFEEHEVDLVLTGHDHNYQRFEPQDETTYVVTGGGGYALYGLGECASGTPDVVVANDQVHHFLHIQGDASRVSVRAIDPDGNQIDAFELTR